MNESEQITEIISYHNYFISVGPKLSESIPRVPFSVPISSSSVFTFKLVDKEYILSLIDKLPLNKASSLDQIPKLFLS